MCLRLVRRVAIQSTREEELKSSGIRIYASLTSLYQPIAATDDESHSSNDTRARQTKSIFFYVPCLFQSDKMLFFSFIFGKYMKFVRFLFSPNWEHTTTTCNNEFDAIFVILGCFCSAAFIPWDAALVLLYFPCFFLFSPKLSRHVQHIC